MKFLTKVSPKKIQFFLEIRFPCTATLIVNLLTLLLHRYKTKLKSKRGNAKEQFENKNFLFPTHIAAPPEGKFLKYEHLVYKET